MTAEQIAYTFRGLKTAGGYMVRCPVHDDRNPSLSITDRNGRLLVHCHAGCPQDAVVAALKERGLWPAATVTTQPARTKTTARRIVAAYDYTDAEGRLRYQVVRYEPKDFRARQPNGRGGWTWNLKGVERVLYHLPEVLEAPIVFIVEGERDVQTLRDWGFVATTLAGGAKSPWLPQYTEALRGREVVIIPDADDAGARWAETVIAALRRHVAHMVRCDLLYDAKDITEFFETGHSEVELLTALEEAWG